MRHLLLLVLGLATVGCGTPRYTWRAAPNGPTALRVQTQFDSKTNLTPEAQKLYVDTIRETLSSWAEILPEAEPAKEGDIRIYGKPTATRPYTSSFMKTHIMAYMDPLSGDAKLIAENRAREQAKGLARWIVNDLQRISLLPGKPIR